MVSHVGPLNTPSSASPETSRANSIFVKTRTPGMYNSPQDPSASPFSPISNTPPTAYTNGTNTSGMESYMGDSAFNHGGGLTPRRQSSSGTARPALQTNMDSYGVLSPISTQPGYQSHQTNTPQAPTFVPQQNVLPFNLPPAQYSNVHNSPARDSSRSFPGNPATDSAHPQPSDLVMLDQMAMPGTVPVFGSDGALNKSPYVGMPEDFMAYLFNFPPSGDGSSSPMSQVMPGPYSK